MANFTELHLNKNPQDPKKSEPKKDDKTKQPKSLSKEKTLFGAARFTPTELKKLTTAS